MLLGLTEMFEINSLHLPVCKQKTVLFDKELFDHSTLYKQKLHLNRLPCLKKGYTYARLNCLKLN